MKKVLVTGVAGFIGSNLADRLLGSGYEVLGIDNLSYGVFEQIPKGVDFHKLDIRSKDIYPLFHGVDAVFHLAAKNCIEDCQEDPVETADINVVGTANVFEAARRAKVSKVVNAESSAVYEGIDIFPTPEANVAPDSFYAVSKVCGNLFARKYAEFHGVVSTGIRPFSVYGSKQDYRRTIPPSMPAFIIKLLKGEQPIIYGDGSKRRDFLYIEDFNDFMLLCITDPRTDGKVFNLGSGTNNSILEIYNVIKKLLASSVDPVFKPNLSGEAQITLADISEARKIGWSPKTGIEEGIQALVDFLSKEKELGRLK
ncbi:MAG: hypothetical protein G01um101420_302 [Parcubacteria group bacterium Gr01-1014_20]|nr:MAG: hypothetical protein G01um101420_302 [Parcubacteria group bacterium Gr01-1014_20]